MGRTTPHATCVPRWGRGGRQCVPTGAGRRRAGVSCHARHHARPGVAVGDSEAAANGAKRDARTATHKQRQRCRWVFFVFTAIGLHRSMLGHYIR
jgi:hypothetical protein